MQNTVSYTGCSGWGGVRRIFWRVMYPIGEINTGVPPGLEGTSDFAGLYKSLTRAIEFEAKVSIFIVILFKFLSNRCLKS